MKSGIRGMELAVFRSTDAGKHFVKTASWSKEDLQSTMETVLSIEGSALRITDKGVKIYVSTEKARPYLAEAAGYQKPGIGVWSIDVLKATAVEELKHSPVTEVLRSNDQAYLHMKDPFCYENEAGDFYLGFCTHPFTWSSSNSAYILMKKGAETCTSPVMNWFPRGPAWDVAITRPTCIIAVPRIGNFSSSPEISLICYDGGE